MPAFLEKKLEKEYGKGDPRVYATMNKIGAMHGNVETAKGREMQKKHDLHVHGGSDHEVIEMADDQEVREIDMHQYAPEYDNTSYTRIVKAKKHWDADQAVPNTWDFDGDGESSGDLDEHGS